MSKTITNGSLVVKHDVAGSQPQLYVRCTVEMPAAEYAAFIALAGLTNSMPTAAHNDITRQVAAGASG